MMPTRTCLECGQPISRRVTRGDLVVEDSPPVAYWRGRGLNLTASMIPILRALARQGDVATDVLAGLLPASENAVGLVQQHISTMRNRLRGQGVPIDIVPIWGVGYRLVLPHSE